jgi:hypothetical protein
MCIVAGSDRNGFGPESSVVCLSETDGDDAAPLARRRLDQIADIERRTD